MDNVPPCVDATSAPPASLHAQLLHLLQQQVAIEERLSAQRALMRRITEGFAVLREWAAHSAQCDISLHDLLVVATYGSGPRHTAVAGEWREDALPAAAGAANPSLLQLLQDAKRAHRSFIRARVLDESCAPPDSVTQFHALTADSFYLLLPHLADILQELVDDSPDAAAAAAAATAPALSEARTPASSSTAEWCASLARVLRFLELGLKHFPEVLENSLLHPNLMESLAQLREGGSSGGKAVLQLCRRADSLWVRLRRLDAVGTTNRNNNDGSPVSR